MDNKKKAVLLMLLSSLAFAFMGAFVKLAGDLPTFQKTFFRNLIAVIITGFIIYRKKENFFGKRENLKFLIIRSALGTLGMISFFYSLDHLLLADASMINKLNPFFVSIFAYFLLKENFSKIQIPTLIIAFLGALMIIKPQFNFDILPAIIGLFGAIFSAGAYTTVRYLGNKESFYTIVFFFSFFSSITTLPVMIIQYKPMTLFQILIMLLVGISAVIGQFTLTISYKLAPAGEISILNYTNVLFSGIIGYFMFDSIPDILSLGGYSLIIIAALIIYFHTNKKNKKI
ncbi:MAG: hypothetical protein PWP28_131 [Oceanotoga sp.]|uniref:EamA domain-containing membrane protein RarD n=1 Tax=Oceanotoga teriensis TaxID=515440 RepID=A0AA45HJ86_9BACT|nr:MULTISPECIES: DMT family transporter [Oceanotoga]MDN5341256.1 hypothetical protein [Oceanotoga sp.]PWJ95681.1 EamA domain-containing membrane protein RarD [Oceanotoga teriensis]